MKTVFTSCVLAGALVGCAGRIPEPTAAQVALASQSWPDSSRETLAQGRDLYLDHCSGCHAVFHPTARPPAAWPPMVREMGDRAKLRARDQDLMIQYLVTAAAQR